MMMMIKAIVNENLRDKKFRPLLNETLDRLERKVTFLENVRDRSTPRVNMDSMRKFIANKNEKQYTQTGPVARRLRTTTNLEIVRIRKHQVKWTILNYKQYRANPARRLTRIEEDKYLRNMTKYEAAINELYRCQCHREMGPEYESLRKKNKSDLLNILRNTQPDRRDGREDLRPDFEKAVDELRRRNRSDGLGKATRCNRCEVKRQIAEQYLSNIEKALQSAAEPLEP